MNERKFLATCTSYGFVFCAHCILYYYLMHTRTSARLNNIKIQPRCSSKKKDGGFYLLRPSLICSPKLQGADAPLFYHFLATPLFLAASATASATDLPILSSKAKGIM